MATSGPLRDELTVNALVEALREAFRPEVTICAHEVAIRMEQHGARNAAERLINEFG